MSTTFALVAATTPGQTATSTSTGMPVATDDAPKGTPNVSSPAAGATTIVGVPSSSSTHNTTLIYYIIFLTIFILLLTLGLWLLHSRKKKQKSQFQAGGANALARDLETQGWSGNARRWVQGVAPWRIGMDGQMNYSRQDGLNELGEAPPPYKVPVDGQHPPSSVHEHAADTDSLHEPTIPLRTLSRDGGERFKLPGYEESIRGSFVPAASPRLGSGHPSPRLHN